ncbi:MAG: threonine ammonia-lyase [Terriglobales bacterium]
MAAQLPGLDDVRAARERIGSRIARTPVLRSRSLNERADATGGTQVFLKCENFQRAGAFKFRGATNCLLQLTEAERRRGVLAFSSGNHAQAVALAARDLGISAALVMPHDAPLAKLDAVRAFGGEVHLYDRATVNREAFAAELVARENRVLVPPFDDARIIAGAGTAALELIEEVPDLEALVVPVGGGGLISGSALAAHGLRPGIEIFGVEPATAADVKLSLERGAITAIADNPTIADGLRTVQPGELTFAIMREHLAGVVTVTDAQLIQALRLLLLRLKIVVEPSGAAAVAAVLSGVVPSKFRRIGVIVSGGNLDASALSKYLAATEGNA